MSKNQIRRLFHGHVNAERIDAALQKLALLDAATCHSELTAGRSSTLWSAFAGQEHAEDEGLLADAEEAVAEEEGT